MKFQSSEELNIANYLENRDLKVICNYRPKFLQGKEIDIFLPDFNLGIEYNGTAYHHSSSSEYVDPFILQTTKEPLYHFNKWLNCFDNGINLINIYDYKWKDDLNRILNLNVINNLVDLNKKISANNSVIKVITTEVANNFYTYNSESRLLVKVCKSYGLYKNDLLIGVVSIKKHSESYIICKFSTLLNYKVTNFIKVISDYIKSDLNINSILLSINLDSDSQILNYYKDFNLLDPELTWVKLSPKLTSLNNPSNKTLEGLFNFKINKYTKVSNELEKLGYLKVYNSGFANIVI